MHARRASLVAVVVAALATTLIGAPSATAAPTATTGPGTLPKDCTSAGAVSRAHFPRHPDVDNQWFPLEPGARFVLTGTVVDGGRTHRHSIVTTVTRLTKVLDGVRTLVLLEEDLDNGTIQESELAFMAEDMTGRVWNAGEYPEEYTDGRLDGAPSTWISGIHGAEAGIGMPAHPRTDTAAYLQGIAPSVDFHDCAKVVRTQQHVCGPRGCYDHVLVIAEWDPLDPQGGTQLKYYAPHVGTVRVEALGGDAPENLHLTRATTLHGSALAEVDRRALLQDARGYRVSPDVYGHTPRAVRGGTGR